MLFYLNKLYCRISLVGLFDVSIGLLLSDQTGLTELAKVSELAFESGVCKQGSCQSGKALVGSDYCGGSNGRGNIGLSEKCIIHFLLVLQGSELELNVRNGYNDTLVAELNILDGVERNVNNLAASLVGEFAGREGKGTLANEDLRRAKVWK